MARNRPERPMFGRSWAKIPKFLERKQNVWFPYIGEPIRHLFRVENIDQWGSNTPMSTTFPFGPPQKGFSVSELGVIFWGSPLFLAVLGLCQFISMSTLDFEPFSMKLGGTVRAIKKWPRRTTDPVRAGITEKRAFLRSAEKWFLA